MGVSYPHISNSGIAKKLGFGLVVALSVMSLVAFCAQIVLGIKTGWGAVWFMYAMIPFALVLIGTFLSVPARMWKSMREEGPLTVKRWLGVFGSAVIGVALAALVAFFSVITPIEDIPYISDPMRDTLTDLSWSTSGSRKHTTYSVEGTARDGRRVKLTAFRVLCGICFEMPRK